MIPYFYKIQEISTGRYYVGCQYGKKSNPENLWVTYFTSNKYIKSRLPSDFKIISILPRIDAREYERTYLSRCYRKLGRERFMELLINRNLAPGILNTPESIMRANSKRRISNSISAKRLFSEGRHNWQIKPAMSLDHNKHKHSKRMLGNNYGSLRKLTPEYRSLQADGARGNTNVRGTKWWFNPDTQEYKRCLNSPGVLWINRGPTTKKKAST